MSESTLELAQLLFPDITKTPEDYYRRYPPRALPDGAKVTRFAPSPTGFVHIGSIMTSLVSKRVAHQSGGVFILRIEDTDKKREQDGSVEAIVTNLINFDLAPDEGIVQVNPEIERGEYAPYIQSERGEIYQAFAKMLVARGLAYPCFASEAELDEIRKRQESLRVKPGYYGEWAIWRGATLEQVKAKLDAGEKPVIRIRAPYPNEGRARFKDAIKGDMDMPANDQDMVLLKSGNRLPTYHFAHVVDDTLMRVNIITRGDEWLPSAPLHVQLFEYLDQPVPVYAHIAPIAKMDGTSKRKLSKRKDPEANVAYYYELGYPKEAVTEYLLNLANSSFYDWRTANPTAPNSEFPLKLEEMGVSSPLFDPVKLNDMSKDVIANYTAEQVYGFALAWAKQYHTNLARILEADPAYAVAVFGVERGGNAPRKDIINWADVERVSGFFFDELFEAAVEAQGYPFPPLPDDTIISVLEACAGAAEISPTKEEWVAQMRALAEQLGFARDGKTYKAAPEMYKGQFGDMMMIVRVGLTGRTQTPDLYEIQRVYGAERARRRLQMAVALLRQGAPN